MDYIDKSDLPREAMVVKLLKLPCISTAFYWKGLDNDDDSKSEREDECGLNNGEKLTRVSRDLNPELFDEEGDNSKKQQEFEFRIV